VESADMLVADILKTPRANHPDKLAIVGESASRTYSALADRVERLAGALASAGVRQRDRIAVLAAGDPSVIEVVLAASLIGAVLVPLNPRVTAEDITYQAEDAKVELAYVQSELEPLARGGGLLRRAAWFSGDDLEKRIAAAEPYRGARPSSDEVLVHLYTSGTTGRPKGCLLTQRGWLSSVAGWAHATTMSDRDVVWPQLPLFHVAGLHFLFTTLAVGATYVADVRGTRLVVQSLCGLGLVGRGPL